jgi:hypothetical protein
MSSERSRSVEMNPQLFESDGEEIDSLTSVQRKLTQLAKSIATN